MLLEVPLVGLAAQRATDDDVAQLKAMLAEAEASPDDSGLVGQVDERLHRKISEIAGNRLAAAFTAWVVEVLQPPLRELVRPAVVESVIVEQHRDIVRGIERGEPARGRARDARAPRLRARPRGRDRGRRAASVPLGKLT